jgi:hypothetical protein
MSRSDDIPPSTHWGTGTPDVRWPETPYEFNHPDHIVSFPPGNGLYTHAYSRQVRLCPGAVGLIDTEPSHLGGSGLTRIHNAAKALLATAMALVGSEDEQPIPGIFPKGAVSGTARAAPARQRVRIISEEPHSGTREHRTLLRGIPQEAQEPTAGGTTQLGGG